MADLFFWLEDVDNQHIGMDITRVNLFFFGWYKTGVFMLHGTTICQDPNCHSPGIVQWVKTKRVHLVL